MVGQAETVANGKTASFQAAPGMSGCHIRIARKVEIE